MGLADALQTLEPKGSPNVCGVALILTRLDETERDLLTSALENFDYRSSDIARLLKSEGLNADSQTVSRHRRGDCKCPR